MTYDLNEKFLRGEFDQDSARAGFGRGLVLASESNVNVVALTADLAESVQFHHFAERFPERFVEVGIAEQNMITVASGMAHVGKIPFAGSYAAFSPGRNWEQIRTTIALNTQPVKIVGSHAGLNVGPDGATHQMLEDIALMRVIPNMVVLAPGDAIEAEKIAQAMAHDQRPNYVRLVRDKSPIFTDKDSPFEIGPAYVLREGKDISIFATGTMTAQALLAANELKQQNISAEVIHFPTIKPLDVETALNSIAKTRRVIVVEEHQIAGGFGSAIAELTTDNLRKIDFISHDKFKKDTTKSILFKQLGIKDRFGQSGAADELLKYYHLTSKNIVHSAHILTHEKTKDNSPNDFKIIYAAYGANRDLEMMRHIIGGEPKILEDNQMCYIKDYELCIQSYDEVPEICFDGSEYGNKSDLIDGWGEKARDFQTYVIRPKHGAKVAAKLYEITGRQHSLIRSWENWFKPILVEVETPDGRSVMAKTECLWEDQTASDTADGLNYDEYLLDRNDMWRVADSAREK